jgi:hypothetical protein
LSATPAQLAPQALPWRPLGELDAKVAGERVQGVLDRFSARWFVRARLAVGGPVLLPAGEAVPQGLLRAGPLRLAAAPDAFTVLTRLALDLHDGGAAATGDEPLIGAFAARLRDELLAALGDTCGREPDIAEFATDGSTAGAVRLAIELPVVPRLQKVNALDLWCPLAALLAWRHSPRRPGLAALPPLVPRQVAWQGTKVRVEAVVGSVRLPATSLVELEPGDVLVLDRALGDACALREPMSKRVVARGLLRKSGGHYGVELQTSI